MGKTEIGWTDFSVNPIRARLAGSGKTRGGYDSGVGHYCEKVSAGCRNCYSSALQPKFGLPQFQEQRNGATESFLDGSKFEEVLRRKKPTKFFWCDMTDMFGSWVPFEWIAACFGVMAATPQHTHQVLTKRPDRALEFFAWLAAQDRDQPRLEVVWQALREETERVGDDGPMHTKHCASPEGPWPLPNVHLGVSCEDQTAADKRIPVLLQCPAAVHWISAEPLLGPITLWGDDEGCLRGPGVIVSGGMTPSTPYEHSEGYDDSYPGLDWVVVGGESGPNRRECDPAWIDDIVAQCSAADVACFVKQDSALKPGQRGRLSDATWAHKEFPLKLPTTDRIG